MPLALSRSWVGVLLSLLGDYSLILSGGGWVLIVSFSLSMGNKVDILDKISRLCDNLWLDESDGPMVRMHKLIYSTAKEGLDLYLVEKVLGNRATNSDGLEKVLKAIWTIPNNFRVEQIDLNNLFMFYFESLKDKNTLLYIAGIFPIFTMLVVWNGQQGKGDNEGPQWQATSLFRNWRDRYIEVDIQAFTFARNRRESPFCDDYISLKRPKAQFFL